MNIDSIHEIPMLDIEWLEIDPREFVLLMFMFYHFYPYFYEYLAADNRIMIGRM